jgi:hypothetical protein
MATRPVTVNDVLDGHVVLDVECLDRLYLNGYVPNAQVGGQVVLFLRHRGFPIPSPAALGKITEAFRRKVRSFAEANDVPWIVFSKGQRKIDVVRPLVERAAASGRSQVVAIGAAQEFQYVFAATQKQGPNGIPWFDFYKTERRIAVYYFYLWDEQFGPCFIKVASYFPFPLKIWVNGHERAKRRCVTEGVGFTELSNGFASCADPPALQAICDRLGPGTINVFFARWSHRLPLPLERADRDAGYWWRLSMRQIETSRTLVLDDPRRTRRFFEALIADNLDLGRPEQVELIFARKPTAATSTRILNAGDQVSINVGFRRSRVKQYLKDGRALRIETVINDPADVGCLRGLEHLDELQAKARAINARVLDAEQVGQGSAVFESPAFARISQPTVTDDGRRAPALRFGDPRAQALAGVLANLCFAVTGITNKSLRALMTGLLGTAYSRNQASYDLTRLRRNGLITRRPHTNTYDLTPDGRAFTIFYTKVHDRVLFPLMAAPTGAPPPVRQALRVLDRHIHDTITGARLHTAA